MKEFKLIEGISIPNRLKEITSQYSLSGNSIISTLSAEEFIPFFKKALKVLNEPIFFFIEAENEAGEYETYYLDNCTRPVIEAILKVYGDLLVNDGLIKFGFGSHKDEDEIYAELYQELSIYSEKNILKYVEILNSLNIEKVEKANTLWDILDESNEGEACNIEFDGITYQNIIENLSSEGLYKAE